MTRPACAVLVLLLHASAAGAGGRAVALTAGDGTSLSAELYDASNRPAPGVVLVHMLSRTRADWDGFANALQDAGFTALAIDLRGHGGSAGSAQRLTDMVQDVRAAAQWLSARPGVRPGAIAIVGASLGANLALLASVDLPVVRALALLSPSLDYRGVRVDATVLKKLGGRPIWMAASTDDPLALRTLKELSTEPSGPREQRLVEGQAHGTQLLGASPDIGSSLLDWLRRTLLS